MSHLQLPAHGRRTQPCPQHRPSPAPSNGACALPAPSPSAPRSSAPASRAARPSSFPARLVAPCFHGHCALAPARFFSRAQASCSLSFLPLSSHDRALSLVVPWPHRDPGRAPFLLPRPAYSPARACFLAAVSPSPELVTMAGVRLHVRRSSLARLCPVRALLASVSRAVASPSHLPLISSIPCARVSSSTWSSFGRGLILALWCAGPASCFLRACSLCALLKFRAAPFCARPGPDARSPLFLSGPAMELAATPAVLPTCARPSTRACPRLALALACLLVVTAARSLFVHRVSRVLAFAVESLNPSSPS